jgi:hypothetical protein
MLAILLLVPCLAVAQMEFVEIIGGDDSEYGRSLVQTGDGGFIVAGRTASYGVAEYSILFSKLDSTGSHLWTRTLGDSGYNYGHSVIEDQNGGIVLAGNAAYDLFITKFDSVGFHLWSRTLGGSSWEYGYSLIQAPDGGFIVGGATGSFGAGAYDIMLCKFSSSGAHLWTKTLGGSSLEYGYSLTCTQDGGFAVVGKTMSFGVEATDMIVSKFDASANHQWTRTLGGSGYDYGYGIAEVSDGNLVVVGQTSSYSGTDGDIVVSKLDITGTHLWTRVLDSDDWDEAFSVIETTEGDLLITGNDGSFRRDLLLSKFDPTGTHLWTRGVGRSDWDEGRDVVQTQDGGFAAVGTSSNFGGINILFCRTDATGNTCLDTTVSAPVFPWTPTIGSPDPVVMDHTPTISNQPLSSGAQFPVVEMVCPICGDCNDDLSVTSGDGYMILNYFGSGPQPTLCWSANVNGDGGLTTADGFHLLNYLGAGPDLDCGLCEF